jgi:dihydroorotase
MPSIPPDSGAMTVFRFPKWYDLHVHVRQGAAMKAYIEAHLSMGCVGILAMPNTKPPVAKILKSDSEPYWSLEEYRDMVLSAGGNAFQALIIPLYLTKDTTPEMIEKGAKAGLLRACKYYPPHGTTNSDHGRPLSTYIENGVLQAMEANGVILCVHGEAHDLPGKEYFAKTTNAEDIFYREYLPRVRDAFPNLKIVCEHITTRTAVEFVTQAGENTGATVTPQHLLYTIGDLLKGLKYHLYCLPVVKFEEDRQALLNAVCNPENNRFFAGTDSAPHTNKMTECGCAAGCFTGGIAPQLYAESIEPDKNPEIFEAFLCRNGPAFYGLPVPSESFGLTLQEHALGPLPTPEGDVYPLLLGLGQKSLKWSLA